MLTNARPFDAAVEMLIPFAIDPPPQDWERRGDAWVWRETVPANDRIVQGFRSEEHTSELQSLMRISYAVFCLKNKNNQLLRSLTTIRRKNTIHETTQRIPRHSPTKSQNSNGQTR